jgi:hypothetical protein
MIEYFIISSYRIFQNQKVEKSDYNFNNFQFFKNEPGGKLLKRKILKI